MGLDGLAGLHRGVLVNNLISTKSPGVLSGTSLSNFVTRSMEIEDYSVEEGWGFDGW